MTGNITLDEALLHYEEMRAAASKLIVYGAALKSEDPGLQKVIDTIRVKAAELLELTGELSI